MKLYYDKRLSDPTYYAQQGIRNGKKTTTRNVKNFGKHSELLKITDDPLVYKAYMAGYLSKMRGKLTAKEMEMLPFAGIYITFEQVLRFLMDYINGDTYYRIAYPEHNLVRTHAQYKLLTSMESQWDEMKNI